MKFTYKNRFVLTNQTCSAPFPMMQTFCFVWFKSFGSACNDGLRQGMFREFQFRQYRLAVLGGWFRLGENIRNVWGSISDGSGLSKAIALTRAMASMYFPPLLAPLCGSIPYCGINCNWS
jgi:hypothetical protein